MKALLIAFLLISFLFSSCKKDSDSDSKNNNNNNAVGMIIDHNCTKLSTIPAAWVDSAKNKLHIAYSHTSHGRQLVDGMTGLIDFKGNLYDWNEGGEDGALDIDDQAMYGDLGNPDRTS